MQHDNAVILTGTIPERPSWSETESGVPIVEFHLQVVSRWTGRAGQQCERPMYLLIRASGHFANSLRKYWHPGAYVNLAGELQQRTYPPEDGRPAQTETYVLAHSLGYLSLSTIIEAQHARTA